MTDLEQRLTERLRRRDAEIERLCAKLEGLEAEPWCYACGEPHNPCTDGHTLNEKPK